jgi:hypothetical protein
VSSSLTRIERNQTRRVLTLLREEFRHLGTPIGVWRPCVYCGHYVYIVPRRLQPVTCGVHSDLPSLDPNYNA